MFIGRMLGRLEPVEGTPHTVRTPPQESLPCSLLNQGLVNQGLAAGLDVLGQEATLQSLPRADSLCLR